jgi:hypothetical protein
LNLNLNFPSFFFKKIKPIGQNSGTHLGFEFGINLEEFEFKLKIEFEFKFKVELEFQFGQYL